MEKLKPCRLCGGRAFVKIEDTTGWKNRDDGIQATIYCKKCGESVTKWALLKSWAKDSAYKAWNIRLEDIKDMNIEDNADFKDFFDPELEGFCCGEKTESYDSEELLSWKELRKLDGAFSYAFNPYGLTNILFLILYRKGILTTSDILNLNGEIDRNTSFGETMNIIEKYL